MTKRDHWILRIGFGAILGVWIWFSLYVNRDYSIVECRTAALEIQRFQACATHPKCSLRLEDLRRYSYWRLQYEGCREPKLRFRRETV